MQKFYIIKNCSPWMLDELLIFADNSKFNLLFLRKQEVFFDDKIKILEGKGIKVTYINKWQNISFNKILFSFLFTIKHLNCFFNLHSFIYGLKSIIYFLKFDGNIINEKTIKIHSQFATQASILGILIKDYYKSKNVSFSFTYHAYDIYVKNRWINLLSAKAENLFSISNYNIDYLFTHYKISDRSKIKYSPLGVFIPNNIPQKQNSEVLNIGFMSYFVEMKGIDYLLPALKELNNLHIDFKFHIAGDGPLKDKIISYIEQNNLKNKTIFYGLIKNQEKEQFFRNLDVFLLPSISKGISTDGLPVVLMESVSYGIPIISTKVSGIPEICINEFNGYLIEQKNINEIVSSLIKFNKTPDIYPKFSRNSLEISKNYNIIDNSNKKLKMLGWI